MMQSDEQEASILKSVGTLASGIHSVMVRRHGVSWPQVVGRIFDIKL